MSLRRQKHEESWVLFADLFASMAIIFLLISVGLVPMTNGGGASTSNACYDKIEKIRIGIEYRREHAADLERAMTGRFNVDDDLNIKIVDQTIHLKGDFRFRPTETTLRHSHRERAQTFCAQLGRVLDLDTKHYRANLLGSTSPEYCSVLSEDQRNLLKTQSLDTDLRTVMDGAELDEIRYEMRKKNIILANTRARHIAELCNRNARADIPHIYNVEATAELPSDEHLIKCAKGHIQNTARSARIVKVVVHAQNCDIPYPEQTAAR